jgi:hypothetical protein
MLCDLTGLDALGEHLAAAEMMDGVVVIARAGRTRETELLELKRELGAGKLLGVVLLGR